MVIHMQDLTVDMVIALHAAIIARDGGDGRIISEANLHELVFRANLIPGLVDRASLALWSLVAYPAFREGNFRTAQKLAFEILAQEGYRIPGEDAAGLEHLIRGIDTFVVEPEDITAWLSTHARKEE